MESGGNAEAGPSANGPGPALPPELTDPGTGGFGGAQAEGAVPATPAPADTSQFPDWGTQLTPQEMIDSGDPALIVAGQEIRRRMAEQGIVDPSGIA